MRVAQHAPQQRGLAQPVANHVGHDREVRGEGVTDRAQLPQPLLIDRHRGIERLGCLALDWRGHVVALGVHFEHTRVAPALVMRLRQPWVSEQNSSIHNPAEQRIRKRLAQHPGALTLAGHEHAVVAALRRDTGQHELHGGHASSHARAHIPGGRILHVSEARAPVFPRSVHCRGQAVRDMMVAGARHPQHDVALGKVNGIEDALCVGLGARSIHRPRARGDARVAHLGYGGQRCRCSELHGVLRPLRPRSSPAPCPGLGHSLCFPHKHATPIGNCEGMLERLWPLRQAENVEPR